MTRVLIVDDEQLVRTGLRMIVEAQPDIEVVAEADSGGAAVTAVTAHRIDVVLMDVRMPGMDGLAALEVIARRPQPPQVIMLTTFDRDTYVHRALQAVAAGFLLKDTPPPDLVAAIRTVAAGGAMLAPTVTRRLITEFAGGNAAEVQAARQRLSVLTDRERQVIDALARGLSNADIGRDLVMSEATVKAHVSRSLAKLGMTNRVQAAILAFQAR